MEFITEEVRDLSEEAAFTDMTNDARNEGLSFVAI